MPTEETTLPTDVEELQKMVTELRKENAKRRVEGKPFDEAFGPFNDAERAYLLDAIKLLGANDAETQAQGAVVMRDMAFSLLGPEQFKDGLDLPAEPAAEKEEKPEKEGEGQVLTKEEVAALLEERDTKAADAKAKAEQEAAVEEIFQEIEALGFERGSEGFMTMLSLGQTRAALGKDVVFAELAPQVASIVGVELPSSTEGEGEAEPEAKPAGFPSTAGAGGAGAPVEPKKDWVKEAKAAGRNPMEVARERAEARLKG